MARVKAWRKANQEKHNELNRQARKRNPDTWHVRNRERSNAHKIAHIHKVRAGGSYTQEEWKALCDAAKNRCLCCLEPKKLTVDHVIPVALGGTNTIDNIQPLCLFCNQRKGTKMIDYRLGLVDSPKNLVF